jgi:predicted nucleic acid-binding protein
MTNSQQAYMLDTNVFNAVIDGNISLEVFAGRRLLVIGVQMAELAATKCAARREALLAIAEKIKPTTLLASSFALDIEGAGLDQAFWNDGTGTFERMLDRLRQLDTKKKQKSGDGLNQDRDILIAETAIKNHAIMVSNDDNLRKVVSEFSGKAITLTQLVV